jgi:hypothetical protein
MKTNPISQSTSPAPASRPPTREQIHALAHELWKDRGCPVGCDMDIWLDAERQLGGNATPFRDGERIDLDTSEAARIERELDRIVSPPAPRSPTAL